MNKYLISQTENLYEVDFIKAACDRMAEKQLVRWGVRSLLDSLLNQK